MKTLNPKEFPELLSLLWRYKTLLWSRNTFGGKTYKDVGDPWFIYHQFPTERFKNKNSISFASVATHNHFALDTEGKIFKRTAPIIKLPDDSTVDDHLSLLAALNSSTACFYMKQVFFAKGGDKTGDGGRRAVEMWHDRYEHDCTKMAQVPIPASRPLELARRLDADGQRMSDLEPWSLAREQAPMPEVLDEAREEQEEVFGRMVALQEELDWRCYESYGLLEAGEAPVVELERLEELPRIELGERAFEIVMARKVEAGDLETSWFTRHGSTPITEIPERWPAWYQELVQARLELIGDRRFIRLIEQPEYKRRWNRNDWEDREQDALRQWLCDRLESPAYVPQADREDQAAQQQAQVMTTRELADVAARDEAFMAVAARYTGDASFEVEALVAQLVLEEAVPFLPAQRYKKSGLERRRVWERVWDEQRQEDAIDARCELPEDHPEHLTPAQADALKAEQVGDIEKPPNYRKSDFQSGPTYRLRGKLDVPKERFVHLQGCAPEGAPEVVLWAGLDHAQRARALAGYYNRVKTQEGRDPGRLGKLLAGILDLVPWVKQWHNELDPLTNTRLGDFIEGFVEQEARELELGVEGVEAVRMGGG